MRLATLLLLAPLLTTGCKTLYEETDQTYWKTTEESAPFLGVVVDDGDGSSARVVHVLRQSPAATMGIQPGDSIVRYGALRVHQSSGLARAIRQVGTTSVEVTVARQGTETVLSGPVGSQRDYAWTAGAGLQAAEQHSETNLPFLYHTADYVIPPSEWEAWRGEAVNSPVVVYSETNLLPILGVFSLFRLETTECRGDKTRFMLFTWPLIFTSSGDEDAQRRALLTAPDAQLTRL